MRFPPLSVIASWPTPNYVDPPTRKPYLIPLLTILTLAATCMVFLRLYARFRYSHAGSDDWLVVVAIIPGIAYTVVISIAVTHFGWDRHIWDIPPGPGNMNAVRERAISWAAQMLYVFVAGLTKISLLCFYRKAFATPTMQKIINWFLAVAVVYTIICILLLCLECRPLNFYWNEFRVPAPPSGWCSDEGTGLMITGMLNLIIDIIILILPIRTVLTLNIVWAQKLQILSIFAAGLLVVICSTIRVYEIWETTEVTFDVTWNGYNAYLFTGVEMFVGLICACLPACRGLLKQWRESARQPHHNSNLNGKHNYSTTTDSERASMPPTSGIKKRTKTTVDIEYMKMENGHPIHRSGSQLNITISGIGDSMLAPTADVWGAHGSAINVTKAWAGKGTKEKGRGVSLRREEMEMEMESLELCANPVKPEAAMDRGRGRRITFEDEKGRSLKFDGLGKESS